MPTVASQPKALRGYSQHGISWLETQETLAGPNGNLQSFWYNENKRAHGVLVLPNGYGVLNYLRTVCQQLAEIGCSVFTLDFSGQGQSDAKLSLKTMTEDLSFAIQMARERLNSSLGITILAHCTAMLPLLELSKKRYDLTGIRLVILYGYLAHPVEHFSRFLRKGKKYKIRIDQSPDDLPNYTSEDYAAFPVPLVVIHPRIPNNIHRASVTDVTKLVQIAKPKAFYVPDFGYAISNHEQVNNVKRIITSFVSPYISIELQASLIKVSLDAIP